MATQYRTWLSTLGTLRADMPVTVRGLPISHSITYPGDVTSATLVGATKASPDADAELANFVIGTPTYDAATNLTTWKFSLPGTTTAQLPADGDGDGVETVIFDFVLTLSGELPKRIIGGLFPISGFVTEPA